MPRGRKPQQEVIQRTDYEESIYQYVLPYRKTVRSGNRQVPVSIPKEVKWKALVMTMRAGEWITIAYIQHCTGFSRDIVRVLLREAIKAGVVEKGEKQEFLIRAKKQYWHKGNGFNMRWYRFYRMDISKMNIVIQ